MLVKITCGNVEDTVLTGFYLLLRGRGVSSHQGGMAADSSPVKDIPVYRNGGR